MQMVFQHIDFDGTLNNPVVLAAVIIWSIILGEITFAIIYNLYQARIRKISSVKSLILSLLFLFFVYISTPISQVFVGNMIYLFVYHIYDVGFIGGPPIWIAPSFGALVGLVCWGYFSLRKFAN